MIYWEWEDINLQSFFEASTIRNILTDTFNNSNFFTTKSIPPTPFREDLVFTFSHDDNVDKYHIKSKKGTDHLQKISVNLAKEKDEHDFFRHLYSLIYRDFFGYFVVLEKNRNIVSKKYKLDEAYQELTNTCYEFQCLHFFQYLRRRYLKKQIKEGIIKLFHGYSSYYSSYCSYEIQKNDILKKFPDNEY